MNESPGAAHPYLVRLERLMMGAILLYALTLAAEVCYIILTLDVVNAVLTRAMKISIFTGAMLGCAALLAWRLETIRNISGINVWLDKRMFGLLASCDAILSDTILSSARVREQITIPADGAKKARLAKTVIDRLARHEKILPGLIGTGIYTWWIWYWITIYGTIVFSFLTGGTFLAILLHAAVGMRPLFLVVWAVALLHLGATVAIGARLKRMTRDAATEIAASYASDIEAYLREGSAD